MAKTGRPRTDHPRSVKVSVRFNEDEYEELRKRAEKDNLTITQTVRKGVEKLLKSKR